MRTPVNRPRRANRQAPGRSYKPWLDVLEDRVQPSVAVIGPLPPISIGPIPPISASSGVITVSTQQLDVTRGGSTASFTVVLNSQPSAEVDVTLAEFDPNAANDGTKVAIAQPHLAFTTDDWSTPQTVNVSSPVGSTPLPPALVQIFGTSDSSDPNFDAQAVPPISVEVCDPVIKPTGGVVVSTNQLQLQVGGPSATYTIALTSQPTADVTVAINPIPTEIGFTESVPGSPIYAQTAKLNVTPQTLTFTPDDWNSPQTVTVSAPAGQTAPAGSTVYLGETAPASSTVYLGNTITSTDPNYNGLTTAPVTVNVTAPGILLSTQSLWVTSGGDGSSFTMALATQPTDTVTITIAQSDFPDGNPLQITPATLTFTPDNWSTPQTVSVAAPTSGTASAMDTLNFSDSSNDPNYNNGTLSFVLVFVQPRAPTGALVLSTQSLTLTAGGPSATYTMALASQPSADVTVQINQFSPIIDPLVPSSASGTPPVAAGPANTTLNITPQTVTFTPDDWNQPVTITVSAPAGPAGVTFLDDTVTSDDSNYNNITAPSVRVNVQNNPAYALVLSTTDLKLALGGTGSYTIALASQPTAEVDVTISDKTFFTAAPIGAQAVSGIAISGASTLTITPTTLAFTPQNWNVAQTVTVTAAASTSPVAVEVDQLVSTVTSSDPNWNNIAVPPVGVFVVPPITIGPGPIGIGPITPPMPTQTTLSVPSNPAVLGQTVTLTAKVTANGPGATAPTGTVTFMDGSTALGTGTLSQGVATLKTANLPVGKNMLTAVYAGASGTTAASTSTAHTATISKAQTGVALTASASPAVYGQEITLTATVSVVGSSAAPPTGTVTFKNGSTVLGTGTLTNGVATLQTSSLAVGVHYLKAVYAGDTGTTTSTGSLTELVKRATTTTAMSASPATATVAFGTPITLTATVSVASPGTASPTGTVTFKSGSSALGTGTLSDGVATFTTSKLSRGKHTLTAVYAGDSHDLGSKSVAVTITID